MGVAGRVSASLVVLCLAASLAAAQPTPSPSSPPAPVAGATAAPAPDGAALPAPTPAFDPEAATREWLAKVPAADKERSDAYFEGGYWLDLWGLLYALAVAWVLLGSGIS